MRWKETVAEANGSDDERKNDETWSGSDEKTWTWSDENEIQKILHGETPV